MTLWFLPPFYVFVERSFFGAPLCPVMPSCTRPCSNHVMKEGPELTHHAPEKMEVKLRFVCLVNCN